jgi:hypothetical protein
VSSPPLSLSLSLFPSPSPFFSPARPLLLPRRAPPSGSAPCPRAPCPGGSAPAPVASHPGVLARAPRRPRPRPSDPRGPSSSRPRVLCARPHAAPACPLWLVPAPVFRALGPASRLARSRASCPGSRAPWRPCHVPPARAQRVRVRKCGCATFDF